MYASEDVCPGPLLSLSLQLWYYMLWCFYALVFLCFGVSMLRCFHALVFRCFGVSMLRCFGVSMLWCFHALGPLCFHALVMYLSWIYDQLVFMPCGLTLLTSLFFFARVYVCIYMYVY
ncbi:hypothetical protein EDC96DRAFT_168863 [Choanephora cucurbitarum]|nr:hypothetical protein EDC96DRAFT_168863 [Choanephora cucurbitarum]